MDSFATYSAVTLSITIIVWHVICFLESRRYLSYIPGPASASWWKGNFDRFFNPEGWKFHEELYRRYGGVARVDMMFGEHHLYVTDPLALHYICVKDQYIYEEGEKFLVSNRLVFGASLLSTLGEEHKRQRKMLNPVFSLKHMRNLLPVFYPIAHKLCTVLEKESSRGQDHFDVMKWISRAALEYVGQGGLGYTFDALDMTRTNAYSEAMKSFNPLMDKLNFFRQFLPQLVKLGSPSFRRRLLEMIPSETVRDLLSVTDTMQKYTKQILRDKKEALKNGDEATRKQVGGGKDILSVLMKAASAGDGATRIPEEELLAHMSTFIAAGHDTTTLAVCRILHILSQNPERQARLRAEVTAARKEYGGDLEYDELMSLPYLDAICRETLRMYPPALLVERITRKDTILPLQWPIKSTHGKDVREIFVRKGTTVYVSIIGANKNKAIWGEDADEWKPERWLKQLPQNLSDAHLPGVYSQMMTFLGGGRACIGFKFSEAELKVVTSLLIEKFIFEPGPEVYWRMGGLLHPVVKVEDGHKTEVPLKVTLVKQ
ncbi:hypothetical protein ACEPAI_9009 [Sanghuangporus weigelae]